jgi:hypothetical protein
VDCAEQRRRVRKTAEDLPMISSRQTVAANEAYVAAAFHRDGAFQCLSDETLAELTRRGLLQTRPSQMWHFGDHSNGCSRYLSGGKWKRADTKGADWHKLAGLEDVVVNDRRFVAFVLEGSKDALAAAELLNRLGLLTRSGIIGAFGAAYRPIAREVQQLSGRKVMVIGDNDSAGRDCISRVSATLCDHSIDHVVLFWPESVKDVFELVQLHVEAKNDFGRLYQVFLSFFSPLTVQEFNDSTVQPLNSSAVQQFNDSTQEEAIELITSFVPSEPCTGNTSSFALARAVRDRQERTGVAPTNLEIDKLHHEWFTRSRPMLPQNADEEKSLRKFYKQLTRVRFLPTALVRAIARARSAPLPQLPNLSNDAQLVALLYRELQRDAGDRGFICPVNTIVEFAGLRWPEQARWIQSVLEKAGVIRCVDRGSPHVTGAPGKSTVWRYLKPL